MVAGKAESRRKGYGERLDSWKEIAVYLHRGVRTVQRWERLRGLPVHRLPGGRRSVICADRQEIDAWWHNRGVQLESDEASHKSRRWVSAVIWIAAALAGAALISLLTDLPVPGIG